MAGPAADNAKAGCHRYPKVEHSHMSPGEPARRQLSACAFCARQEWPEEQCCVYLAGEHCFMPTPALVAELLSVEWYKTQWPLIPAEELDASAVDLPHLSVSGEPASSKVLMHRRRVTAARLRGEERVLVCAGTMKHIDDGIPCSPRLPCAIFCGWDDPRRSCARLVWDTNCYSP